MRLCGSSRENLMDRETKRIKDQNVDTQDTLSMKIQRYLKYANLVLGNNKVNNMDNKKVVISLFHGN